MKFEVGDKVECIDPAHGLIKGKIYTVGRIRDEWISTTDNPEDATLFAIRFKLVESKSKTQTTKENKMNVNSTVAKVFKNVDDAILVTKYLGKEYEEGNHRAYLDLKANDKVVLAETKRLEKEEKEG